MIGCHFKILSILFLCNHHVANYSKRTRSIYILKIEHNKESARTIFSARPPPEDLLCVEQPQLESRSVLHLGNGGVLYNPDCLLGVEHQFLRFSFGNSRRFVGVWNSSFSTPRFTVEGYKSDNNTVIVSLSAEDIEDSLPFADLFELVVSIDSSEQVYTFASDRNLVLFEGVDALYWAIHYTITR